MAIHQLPGFGASENSGAAAAPALRRVPAQVGKYEVTSEIGSGEPVKVYRAVDREIGRPVTLKVLTQAADPALGWRFREEIALVARLRSENVIAIYELGEHAGVRFAAMQVLSDADLRHAIRSASRLTLLQKATIMWQVAEGMWSLYAAGLPYLGIRPSAIAVDEHGAATIQDFGIVRLTPAADDEAAVYTPPEQAGNGGAPDLLSDIFSFGAVYYELVSGHRFDWREPVPLRDVAPDCLEELARVIHRAIEVRREVRYQSLDDLQDDARPIIQQLKRERGEALVEEAQRLITAEEFDQAQRVLRDALELHPDSDAGQRLRSELRSTLRKRAVRPRVEALVREAEEAAATRRFDRAIELLEAAERLDDGDTEVKASLEQVRTRLSEEAAQAAKLCEEAQWLLDRDRPDLAAEFLRHNTGERAPHPEVASRLAVIEELLPQWEERRAIGQTLRRSAELEELQQFSVALTVLETAIDKFPHSQELIAHAERLRNRISGDERQRKLARRVEAIRHRIAANSWAHALALIETAEREFPGESELHALRQAAEEGSRRAEVEEIVAEVRQCLADGELDCAEAGLARGFEKLPGDAALEAMHHELRAEREYRDGWREAQVLFGKGRFQEAELILMRLVSKDRPEVELLLNKAREARATRHEDQFYKEGREKALRLIAEQQLEEAADLLRNLLTLFPGDPILERDLESVGRVSNLLEVDHDRGRALAGTELQLRFGGPEGPSGLKPALRWLQNRWAAFAVSGLLLSAATGTVLWKTSRPRPQAPAPTTPKPTVATPPPQPVVTTTAAPPAEEKVTPKKTPPPAPRPFDAAALAPPKTPQSQPDGVFPLPDTLVTATPAADPGAVARVLEPRNAPAPPPPPARETPARPEPAPETRAGSQIQQPELVSAPPPGMPVLAKQLGLTGVVKLEATVQADGTVDHVRTISGHPVLVQSAREAVLKRRYKPATLNGRPISARVEISILFVAGRK